MKMSRRIRPWITGSLTLGASLLLGLLSFSGMYAIFPLVGLSFASLLLSVFYEGEIYKKNIQAALDKLFKPNFMLEKIGQEALEALENQDLAFVRDYQKAQKRGKKPQIMARWLAKLLLHPPQTPNAYQQEILAQIDPTKYQVAWQNLRQRNRWILGFSALTAVVMSLGTVYLLLDMLEVIPIFGFALLQSPWLVVPLALIAGIAYGLLTYNSLISFLSDHHLAQWWNKFKHELLHSPWSLKKTALMLASLFIFSLNLGLTLCTAGTWWTVMNQQRNLWTWFNHLSIRVLGWITPGVMGIANLGFNTRNIMETIKSIDPSQAHHHHHHHHVLSETKAQLWNPFRILLKLSYMPVRILMFIGHLISIGVTGDRMPGVPAVLSALLGIVSEGFEDAHYFFDLDGAEHGHEHGDLPNQVLLLVFAPLFALAATWHYSFQAQPNQTWMDAFWLMQGKDLHVHHEEEEHAESISQSWEREAAFMKIDKQLASCALSSENIVEIKQRLERNQSIAHMGLFSPQVASKLEALCQKAFKPC